MMLLIFLVLTISLSNEHKGHKSFFSMNKKDKNESEQVKNIMEQRIKYLPGSEKIIGWIVKSYEKYSRLNEIVQILTSVSLISLTPIMILYSIPICQESVSKKSFIYKILISFAGGSLLGDSLLHLIPHTLYENSESVNEIGTSIMIGIFIFYLIERIFILIKHKSENKSNIAEEAIKVNSKKPVVKNIHNTIIQNHTHETSAILNLLSDTIHNFIDGMAISSSYMVSTKSGITTTISVFLHEIPHEISDFAILLKSGIKPIKAIFLQIITAFGALTGALITYYLGQVLRTDYLYVIPSLTAGGFIYISCVNIIPDIISNDSSKIHFMLESLSLFAGFWLFTQID